MADTVVAASLTLDAKQANQSVKEFKQELKTAGAELQANIDKFGQTSIQAQNAAKKVAELKDRIADSKKLVDSFNPDEKFRGFTQVLTGVAGGFSAITGAMGLLGVQSEDVQKQLLKVQSALAITQGLNSIGDSIQSFKNLGATLVQTLGKGGLIGLAIAGVGLLAAAFAGLFDSADKANDANKELSESAKDYAKAAATATQQVSELKAAFELARSGVVSKEVALKQYNDTLGDSFGKTNDLTEAERLLTSKADDYIKATGLKAQANAIFAKSAQAAADLAISIAEQERGLKKFRDDNAKLLAAGDISDEIRIRGDISRTQKDIDARKAKLEADKKFLDDLAGGLLKQAAELESGAGITGKTQQQLDEEAAKKNKEFIANHVFINGRWYTKEEWKQVQDDAAIAIGVKAAETGRLSGTVDVERVKTQEEIDLEARLKANKDYVESKKVLLTTDAENEFIHTKDLEAATRARIAQQDAEYQNRKAVAGATVNLLEAVADLFGRQTAAGKALGVATATINTLIGITEVFRAKTVLPEPFGTIAKIASAATIAINGFATVRKIMSVSVPGGGAGGGSVPSFTPQAPLQPQAQVSTTRLDQSSINNTNNATVQAYVLEAQGADATERRIRLNRAARLGG